MDNINEGHIVEYIRNLVPEKSQLKDLEAYAVKNHIPIVEPEVAQLLRVLIKMQRPRNILEVGTAIGYSAIVMAKNTGEDTRITSIERRKDMVQLARENIDKYQFNNKIRVIEGDAGEILPSIEENYDFIFLDAAKGQYMDFFNEAIRLLKAGGIIVSDNVLFKGMVSSDKLVIRRKKTIVKRLRSFLKYINQIDGFTSSIIPIGDGLAITYREV